MTPPLCRWACDDPVCHAKCRPVLTEILECVCASNHSSKILHVVDCPEQPVDETCPNCTIRVVKSNGCSNENIVCTQISSAWVCEKPNCEKPTCELVCEQPVCSTEFIAKEIRPPRGPPTNWLFIAIGLAGGYYTYKVFGDILKSTEIKHELTVQTIEESV